MPYKDNAQRRARAAVKRGENRGAYNASMRRCRDQRMAADPEAEAKNDAAKFSRHYATVKGRALHMLNNARARARRCGVECTLTADWIVQRLEAGYCEVTEIAFDMTVGRGKGHRENAFVPSVERKDPRGPYSPANCVMTVWIYNRAKGAFSSEDLMTLVRALFHAEEEGRL